MLLSTIILNKDFDEYFYFIDKKKYFSKYMSNEDLVEILISQKKKILINNKNSRFLNKIDFRNKLIIINNGHLHKFSPRVFLYPCFCFIVYLWRKYHILV